MVSMDDAVIARLERAGEHFEILVDSNLLEKYHEGSLEKIEDLFAIETIFEDSRKGERASEENMEKAFQTTEFIKIADYILEHGHVQLTTEKRREMIEKKTKLVISEIARNAMNPQTRTPHPPQRIEAAMKEAGVHIDPFKPVEAQIPGILEALRPVIPISFDKIKIAVKLPGTEYGRLYSDMVGMGKIIREEWLKDGSWAGIVEIPAGIQNEFYEALNEKTKGLAETKLVK
ncbi:MAG: ribosome assembly factor SBDS [Candidatus Thermoplasmatota archaeon]|nr:ribosome assembly factor SBDS [Candidatus Thermoplasmatota archaeon]